MNETIEWRYTKTDRPYAAIVRFFIENMNPETGAADSKRVGQVLVVHRVANTEDGATCIVGMVDARANENANQRARSSPMKPHQILYADGTRQAITQGWTLCRYTVILRFEPMSAIDSINSKLATAFNPDHLEVINESHLHAGHQPGFDGGGETHIRIRIVAVRLKAKAVSIGIAPSMRWYRMKSMRACTPLPLTQKRRQKWLQSRNQCPIQKNISSDATSN